MCVHVKKWREDAQPEWPEVTSAGDPSVAGEGAQAFPETIGAGFPRGTGIPAGADRAPVGADATAKPGRAGGPLPDGVRADGTDATPSTAEIWSRPEAAVRTTAVRDPWEEAGASGFGQEPGDGSDPAHDPHEVTVQLDGIGQQLEDLLVRQAKGGDPGADPAAGDGSDGPVFVDESGRRSRRYRRIGIAAGTACAVYAVVIVATLLSGNSNAPWLPVPGQQEGQPAGKIDTSPLPAESAPPSGRAGVSPGPVPTVGNGTAPAPGASATAPGATGRPGASADASPSPTATAPGPGTGSTPANPTPTTDAPVTTPPPDPTPTDPGPTATPTETTGAGDTGGPGTGTVADGPSDPTPIATEPNGTEPAPSPSAQAVL
ncbi:hypothetical protein [Streptomyces sp. AC555_RSS877]|uniref:hypothetical protein n=1 Tax=Streptomyces sp. AC555_RSS877 TaxID=2823688 RepID=UPI0020B8D33B|nr:hypothetical protein [Streptomyces sp. AC555_RSS877]